MKNKSYLLILMGLTMMFVITAFQFRMDNALHENVATNELPYFMRRSSDWAAQQLKQLSLEEKIAQSIMVATWPNKGKLHQNEIDSLIRKYNIGGLIVFQGELAETKQQIKHFQQSAKTPLLIGMDAEWGSAMRMKDAQRFPFAITMGSANLPKQTEVIAKQMAFELSEIGVHLNFAPVVDVNSNPNNPVIGFRAFGESPLLVGQQGTAFINGLEGNGVLSCLKHFPGHGDTDVDSHYDLPTLNKSLRDLDIEDWTPFKMGRLAGASTLMMAHLRVPNLDSTGIPSSLSKTIIQDIVRNRLKFSGLIISDALNMKAVSDRYGKTEVAVMAYEAGNDVLLYPEEIAQVIQQLAKKVREGKIPESVVDDKCLRILKAKDHVVNRKKMPEAVDQHKLDFAHWQIYEKAITVIKNEGFIPLKGAQTTLVISLGNTQKEMENRFNDYFDATYVYAKDMNELKAKWNSDYAHFDQIVVAVYASSMLPKNNFNYPLGWQKVSELLPEKAAKGLVLFGNPYVWKDDALLANYDAVVFAIEHASWAADRAAQLLAGAYEASGKISVSLTSEIPSGSGITTPKASRLKYTVPEELGVCRKKLQEIDEIATNGITQGAYPGCQIVAAKDGKVFYQKSFGHHTYEKEIEVNNATVYDLASVTKIASSTIALMALQDQNKFKLNKTLKDYLPALVEGTPYAAVSLKDMMAHQAGLSPWIPFYTKTLTNGKLMPDLYSNVPNDSMSLWVADHVFLKNTYEDEMYHRILTTPLKPGNAYKYSDLGYYFTKKIIEEQSGKGLDEFVLNHFYLPMGLRSMRYNPIQHYDRSIIAPTEKDTYYRQQLVQGYVHDMGAAMTNGVGGHAGLFSSAIDLAALMQMLLNNGMYGGERLLSPEVIKEYTACQFCPRNRRGAGFDKPVRNLEGGPTCNLVSLSSFGHTGFTGTMTWADPEHGINYVFLSNRVYPSAENWKLVKMGIRTDIQRVIYEAIKDAKL